MATRSAHLEALGRAVRESRTQLGMTQEGLAAATGLHWTYIGGIERGERNPTFETILRVAAGLDLRPSELVELSERLQQRSR